MVNPGLQSISTKPSFLLFKQPRILNSPYLSTELYSKTNINNLCHRYVLMNRKSFNLASFLSTITLRLPLLPLELLRWRVPGVVIWNLSKVSQVKTWAFPQFDYMHRLLLHLPHRQHLRARPRRPARQQAVCLRHLLPQLPPPPTQCQDLQLLYRLNISFACCTKLYN